MKTIGTIILATLIWIYIQIAVAELSPCSVWSSTPSLCDSDMQPDVE
jgi:hypothetical protein